MANFEKNVKFEYRKDLFALDSKCKPYIAAWSNKTFEVDELGKSQGCKLAVEYFD